MELEFPESFLPQKLSSAQPSEGGSSALGQEYSEDLRSKNKTFGCWELIKREISSLLPLTSCTLSPLSSKNYWCFLPRFCPQRNRKWLAYGTAGTQWLLLVYKPFLTTLLVRCCTESCWWASAAISLQYSYVHSVSRTDSESCYEFTIWCSFNRRSHKKAVCETNRAYVQEDI